MIPGQREPRVLGDYRRDAREKLITREEAVADAEAALGEARVLEPYFPRKPLPAGAPESLSGERVAYEELDDDLQDLLNNLPPSPGGDFDVDDILTNADADVLVNQDGNVLVTG